MIIPEVSGKSTQDGLRLIDVEGGYVNDPDDPGGETHFGVTVATARQSGFTKPMIQMTKEDAFAIYVNKYWVQPGFDLIAQVSHVIADELFDTGVNMGVHFPQLWIQEWLNAFNDGGSLYADIAEDADIGLRTVNALRYWCNVVAWMIPRR